MCLSLSIILPWWLFKECIILFAEKLSDLCFNPFESRISSPWISLISEWLSNSGKSRAHDLLVRLHQTLLFQVELSLSRALVIFLFLTTLASVFWWAVIEVCRVWQEPLPIKRKEPRNHSGLVISNLLPSHLVSTVSYFQILFMLLCQKYSLEVNSLGLSSENTGFHGLYWWN